jgi:hypothetical protein
MTVQTFDEYWLAYLAGHSKPTTRFLHYVGLFAAPLLGLAGSFFVTWWAFFVVAPLFYVIAYFTHPYLEHNSNKPFADRPLWSAIAFLRMLWLDLTGRLGKQIDRANAAQH